MPSELSKLTAAGRADVLPGRMIGVFRLCHYAEAEEEFARAHLATAATVAAGVPPAVARELLAAATKNVANGTFKFGERAFDEQAFCSAHAGFLLWVSLRVHDSRVTRPQAEKLLTAENESAVVRAVRECMGYKFDRPAEGEADPKKPGAGETDPSIGGGSSPPSAPTE